MAKITYAKAVAELLKSRRKTESLKGKLRAVGEKVNKNADLLEAHKDKRFEVAFNLKNVVADINAALFLK